LRTSKLDKEGKGMKASKSCLDALFHLPRPGRRARSVSSVLPKPADASSPLGGILVFLSFLSGCAGAQSHVDRALMAETGASARNQGVAQRYKIGCPDVLDVAVSGRPDLSRRVAVGPDGRIGFGRAGAALVEGRTPEEAAVRVAEDLGLPVQRVVVRVAEFKSREVYLSGPGIGIPRTVPYRGPETVLDVLQRMGGITPAAAPEQVYVVRSHIADGERPEVFHVDLRAIVMKNDDKTNVRLQPFDQVYVGETRQGKLDKCLPPWLRPLYQLIWGIREPAGGANPLNVQVRLGESESGSRS
jgi:protein involved in polysaccharide export with SLBB domain